MTQKLNCQQISFAISTIKSKRAIFKNKFSENDIEVSIKLMGEIKATIKEIEDSVWSLEILTKENIGKQYDEWDEAYKNFDPRYKLPSKKRVIEFLQKKHAFVELMETKEKQGLTKMIIAPAPGFHSLKKFADNVGSKVEEYGGEENNYSGMMLSMLSDEENIRYFGIIDKTHIFTPESTGGKTAQEIKVNPDEYGICDGWMISFTTDEQDIFIGSKSSQITGDGRDAIKMGLKASDYQELYFSGKNEMYKGEEAMMPQEYFAMFMKDLYEKYIKTGRTIGMNARDLPDIISITWFIGTYLPNSSLLPLATWESDNCNIDCSDYDSRNTSESIGIRSVVRRKLAPERKSRPSFLQKWLKK